MALLDIQAMRVRIEDLIARYYALTVKAKLALWAWVILQWIIFILFFWITPKRIFEGLANWANELREAPGGVFLFLGLTLVTSFPPMFGFTTSCMLCGFAYGMVKGFLVAYIGMVSGAMASFILARAFFSKYAQRMLDQSSFFKAFGTAIKQRGVPLLCLMRLTPIPWAYMNFCLATFKEISPFHFFLATSAYSPKLLLHVYIGTRLYLFSDPDHLDDMDTTTKWLNSLSLVVSILLGVGVGSYAYRLMAGYAARGEVALVEEEDLDRYLAEEERLQEEEDLEANGAPLRPTSRQRSTSSSSSAARSSSSSEDDEDQQAWEGAFNDHGESEARRSVALERLP